MHVHGLPAFYINKDISWVGYIRLLEEARHANAPGIQGTNHPFLDGAPHEPIEDLERLLQQALISLKEGYALPVILEQRKQNLLVDNFQGIKATY